MALAALKALVDGEDLQELLDKLNRGILLGNLCQREPSTKDGDHTEDIRIKAEKLGSTRKTSRTQEDTQMPPGSSGKENTGGRRTEKGSPAN
ncbi:hypothetical protein Trydic_g21388 [Trypoxylus dichotomus]